jgi:hypothetical protein
VYPVALLDAWYFHGGGSQLIRFLADCCCSLGDSRDILGRIDWFRSRLGCRCSDLPLHSAEQFPAFRQRFFGLQPCLVKRSEPLAFCFLELFEACIGAFLGIHSEPPGLLQLAFCRSSFGLDIDQ